MIGATTVVLTLEMGCTTCPKGVNIHIIYCPVNILLVMLVKYIYLFLMLLVRRGLTEFHELKTSYSKECTLTNILLHLFLYSE